MTIILVMRRSNLGEGVWYPRHREPLLYWETGTYYCAAFMCSDMFLTGGPQRLPFHPPPPGYNPSGTHGDDQNKEKFESYQLPTSSNVSMRGSANRIMLCPGLAL